MVENLTLFSLVLYLNPMTEHIAPYATENKPYDS